uniref:Uncharacterized protein ycf35 n=1 Tax=Dipterocladia arabiensis TaxID=2007176 RepID=A0A1Z1M0C7_9FLOR|nr:hypothetical protein [Dipterocladia arabiensis]ARW59310.1 hypothetical protein [Dipterocladia arabiensis]
MSHFSKIKTNISDAEILKQTLQELGFTYKLTDSLNQNNKNVIMQDDIIVFKENPVFNFIWDGYQYNLVADFYLWNLDATPNFFLEKLTQKYAYNLILDESISIGFDQQQSICMSDGSLKLIVEKWNN